MLRDLVRVGEGIATDHLLVLSLVIATIYIISQRYVYGLNHYPGPLFASLTNNWRAVDVWRRETHYSFRRIHEKYGEIVRIAPNVLSFANPDAISEIYSLNKGYTKVSMECPFTSASSELCSNKV